MFEPKPQPISPVEARTAAERDISNARLHGALDALIALLERGVADIKQREANDA